MTVFPQLRDALADAARDHYGGSRRRWSARRPRRSLLVTATACVGVVAVLLLAFRGDDQELATAPMQFPPVPDSTLTISAALTRDPARTPAGADETRPTPIPDDELVEVAGTVRARLAYPPGIRDDLQWLGAEGDMAQIDHRSDLQQVMEHRAGCLWLSFWLQAKAAGAVESASAAATVLGEVGRWPATRGMPTEDATAERWAGMARLARQGDADALAQAERRDCSAR
jgi:hypothetical protein